MITVQIYKWIKITQEKNYHIRVGDVARIFFFFFEREGLIIFFLYRSGFILGFGPYTAIQIYVYNVHDNASLLVTLTLVYLKYLYYIIFKLSLGYGAYTQLLNTIKVLSTNDDSLS